MSIVQKILLWGSRQAWLERQARRREFARKSALRFTPGEDIDAALRVVKKFHTAGITSMVHELGENVVEPNEMDEGFFNICERLLRDDAREAGAFVSAATHDDNLIAQLTEHAESRGLGKDQYEVQMLYNIREPRQFELAELG